MIPLKLVETTPGNHSLLLNAGTTAVDGVVEEFGHEANGYFWEGIAQLLVATEATDLEGRFKYDPEGGMFVAYGEDVAAFVVLKEGHAVSGEEIAAYCREHLADYKCPKSVRVVTALPKGPTGKVLKRELQALWKQSSRQ